MAGFIKRNGKIAQRLTVISVLPLLALGAIIMILGYYLLGNALEKEIKNELENTAKLTKVYMDVRFPGDFHLENEGSAGGVLVMKGDQDITQAYGIVEEVAGETGMEISFYYWDTCVLTTITDKAGARAVATGAADVIQTDVLKNRTATFYPNTRIFNNNYYSFYMPVMNELDEVIGMISVAKPCNEVETTIRNALIPLILFVILAMVIMVILVMNYTRGVIKTLKQLNDFTVKASAGDATVELDQEVIDRNDELGEMGGAVLSMHRALRDMMERDPLTKLFNRRSADRKLAPIVDKFQNGGKTFSVGIGDIDFFKKVNDTYGHDAGDAVLVAVAKLAQDHMKKAGFVARWGGEEFLFVFDKANQKQARKSLEELLQKIRELEVIYGDQVITLTMSYGIIGAGEHPGMSLEDLIRNADDRLYYAKKNGRNRVVAEIALAETEAAADMEKTSEAKAETDNQTEGTSSTMESSDGQDGMVFLSPEEVDKLLGGDDGSVPLKLVPGEEQSEVVVENEPEVEKTEETAVTLENKLETVEEPEVAVEETEEQPELAEEQQEVTEESEPEILDEAEEIVEEQPGVTPENEPEAVEEPNEVTEEQPELVEEEPEVAEESASETVEEPEVIEEQPELVEEPSEMIVESEPEAVEESGEPKQLSSEEYLEQLLKQMM